MSCDLISSLLFGQTDAVPVPQPWAWLWTLLRVALALPIPVWLGYWVAGLLRMRDYGWKLAAIFVALAASAVIIQAGKLNLGVDLKGGAILVYEIDRETLKREGGGELISSSIDWAGLIRRLGDRINPAGTKEIIVRPYGEWQIEVIVPEANPIELERIKYLIRTAGELEFRIVANSRHHEKHIRLAEEQSHDPEKSLSRFVTDGKNNVGFWARVAREEEPEEGVFPFKVSPAGYTIRNAKTGDLIRLPPTFDFREKHGLERYLREQGITEIDILMAYDDGFDVKGEHLGVVTQGRDETLRPCVHFNMKAAAAGRMGGLTGSARPEGDFYQLLGIMLDGKLLSAPRVMSTISDRGQITGNFTVEEVERLVGVLQAGSLPAALKPTPINENQIGAILGEDTITKGTYATVASLLAVVAFMMVWYRLSGLIAAAAVTLNLVLIVSLMMLVHAALTLPGLAGMVLTVGMAVDANVLIYERIREELEKGAALRMAIRNGFARAFGVILDSNLTTIFSALILYAIGTDNLKGFAVTLTLGIAASMFTAVFCAHVAFDILERKRVIRSLNMRHIPVFSVDYVRQCRFWVITSLTVILIGLAACVLRGKRLFDIDFTGGTSVTMVLAEPTSETDIRQKLDDEFKNKRDEFGSSYQYSVNRVDVKVKDQTRVDWKIDCSMPKVQDLEDTLKSTFPVARYSMEYAGLTETRVAVPEPKKQPGAAGTKEKSPPPATDTKKPVEGAKEPAAPATKDKSAPPPADTKKPAEGAKPPTAKPETPPANKAEPSKDATSRTDLPPDTMLALADDLAPKTPAADVAKPDAPAPKAALKPDLPAKEPTKPQPEKKAQPKAEAKPAPKPEAKTQPEPPAKPQPKADEEPTADATTPPPAAKPQPKVEEKPSAKEPAEATKPRERIVTEAELTFAHEIAGRTVQSQIVNAANALGVALAEGQVTIKLLEDNPDWRIEDGKGYRLWKVGIGVSQDTAKRILEQVQEKLKTTPVWSSSSEIGAKVAGDTRTIAFVALIASWASIILYLWVRFQRVIWGVAAVVALVHDVFVTLAGIALSYWAAGPLGFLGINEFKIGLTEIAAFLTIIGYSVNDTIVIFDRIREIRGKTPELTPKMINDAVNQTLGRTLLTATTVFIVVFILYAWGGEGIHGFAFAMLIGTVVGCYSSIFIAAPIVLWMLPKSKKPGELEKVL
jgi:SecD/SecF fusion protein